jgi:hypothetical protein
MLVLDTGQVRAGERSNKLRQVIENHPLARTAKIKIVWKAALVTILNHWREI